MRTGLNRARRLYERKATFELIQLGFKILCSNDRFEDCGARNAALQVRLGYFLCGKPTGYRKIIRDIVLPLAITYANYGIYSPRAKTIVITK